jgi:hypothetical protein
MNSLLFDLFIVPLQCKRLCHAKEVYLIDFTLRTIKRKSEVTVLKSFQVYNIMIIIKNYLLTRSALGYVDGIVYQIKDGNKLTS